MLSRFISLLSTMIMVISFTNCKTSSNKNSQVENISSDKTTGPGRSLPADDGVSSPTPVDFDPAFAISLKSFGWVQETNCIQQVVYHYSDNTKDTLIEISEAPCPTDSYSLINHLPTVILSYASLQPDDGTTMAHLFKAGPPFPTAQVNKQNQVIGRLNITLDGPNSGFHIAALCTNDSGVQNSQLASNDFSLLCNLHINQNGAIDSLTIKDWADDMKSSYEYTPRPAEEPSSEAPSE